MALENFISGETAGAVGVGGLGLLFLRKLVKGWFEDKKEVVLTDAETQLYKTLVAENQRMAQTIEHMSKQIEVLIKDNNTLKDEVAEVSRKLEASNDWEKTAKELQEELRQRDLVIAKMAVNTNKE